MKKPIRAWAIMPSFSDSPELERYPFCAENRQFMIYLTKKDADKENKGMDESVEPCQITFPEINK